jgi:hypothetical protein
LKRQSTTNNPQTGEPHHVGHQHHNVNLLAFGGLRGGAYNPGYSSSHPRVKKRKAMNQQQALKRIDNAVRSTRVVIVQPSAKCATKKLPSCCEFHSAVLPKGGRANRDCRARRSSSLNKIVSSRLVVTAFLLLSFALAGTWEYADIERAELASKQAQVKTARAN